MTIKEGLALPADKNGRVEIPDVGRRQLPDFFKKDMGYEVGVEVGVQRSYFLRRFCRAGLKMYGVDPWRVYPDYREQYDKQVRQDAIYQNALENVADWPSCELIRKTSMEAVHDFEDNSIDFVYIDGHHGFKYVTEDIFEWSKKVRPGGIISGHDYGYKRNKPNSPYILQVKFVIDAYVKAFEIKKWYVLGNKVKEREGERRDQWRSWFWIKE